MKVIQQGRDLLKRSLLKTGLFSLCTSEFIDEISKNVTVQSYRKRETVFFKGDTPDGLYIVQKGIIEIISNEHNSKELLLNVLREKDYFGEVSLFDLGPRTATARTASAAILLFLPLQSWDTLLRTIDRESLISFLKGLCRLIRHTSQKLDGNSFHNLQKRLAIQLLALCQNEIFFIQRTDTITLSISQEKLANLIGASREATNRCLASMEMAGILSRGRKLIKVNDIEALRKIEEHTI